MAYTKLEKVASNRYSSIKSRTKKSRNNINNWKREDFIQWYVEEIKECYYCKCTEEELSKFHKLDKYKSKRNKRGTSLEIERKEDIGYEQSNCILACYWCNNAKSDAFSFDEFKPVGISIGKAIKKAINNV